jgi:multiple sugar transport system permease protein
MFPRALSEASFPGRIGHRVALPVALVVWLVPLFAVAFISTRSADQLARGDYWSLTGGDVLAGYRTLLSGSPTGQFLLNTVIITVPAVFGTLAVAVMAAFALARHRIPAGRVLLAVFIAGNLVPMQMLMIPLRSVFTGPLPLYDTRLGLILFHVAFQAGFCTFFLRGFIRAIPEAVIDAARLDGATEFQVLRHVALPLMRPALAALAVLEFTFIWNDYFWSLVLTQSDAVRPLTAGLRTLRGMYLSSWNLIAAAALIAALPPVVLFLAMQRRLIGGELVPGARRR